ncbi:DUF5694 domain-containing protein [Povalibacter sp.]|uniref:DUF5694 domain-containing protein n=1 Tax=Povalibacter sp. TaxID=1962978 RepID=UPI002F42CCB8
MRSAAIAGILCLPVLSLVALLGAVAHSADAPKAQVMLVATYHFANPGKDIHNVEAADVLSARRQKEIVDIAQGLARFEPTRVAVEWPRDLADERYAKYIAGELPESRNEVVQLGFRLAQARHLPQVDGIDVDGEFPFEAVEHWAGAHGRHLEIEHLMSMARAEVDKISALQQEGTIGAVLRYINAPQSIERNHSFYPALLTMGSGTDQPGVALLAAWQTRNLAICARLLQIARPGQRIVALYGQGHVYLLQQCLREQPSIELIDARGFL